MSLNLILKSFCYLAAGTFFSGFAFADDSLKAPQLSDEEIQALGSGIFKCLKAEHQQEGWERKHADRTRHEDFFDYLSPNFKAEIEQLARSNDAVYRVVAVGYDSNSSVDTAYISILERSDGMVVVRPVVRQINGYDFSRFSGQACAPGEWRASIDAFMGEIKKPKDTELTSASSEELAIPSGQRVRADLVGSWTCEGEGKLENQGVMEEWNMSSSVVLASSGTFERTFSLFHGDDTVRTSSNGRWYASDDVLTIKTSFQNVDQLIVDGQEIPKLALALGSLVDGVMRSAPDSSFEIKKRGIVFSRLTLEEQGSYPIICELSDD